MSDVRHKAMKHVLGQLAARMAADANGDDTAGMSSSDMAAERRRSARGPDSPGSRPDTGTLHLTAADMTDSERKDKDFGLGLDEEANEALSGENDPARARLAQR